MSPDRRVSFLIPTGALDALCAAARQAGRTPADLLRDAVVAALGRSQARPAAAQGVADALRAATGWVDLQTRLRAAGLVLRAAAGHSIALHDWPSDRFIMPGPAAGIDPDALTLRFRAPFPGFAGLTAAAARPGPATLPGFASRRNRGEVTTAASLPAATGTAAQPLRLPPAARVPAGADAAAAGITGRDGTAPTRRAA
jgi:hypothetical protein